MIEALFIATHFFVFNAADLIGRTAPGISPRYFTIYNPRILATLAFLRLLFWPLFWACNVSGRGPWLPIFGDITFFFILVLFGLSNGWVATCLMMEGPMYVPVHEREQANSLLSFCLCIGFVIVWSGLMLVWRWEVSCRFWCLRRLSGRLESLNL